MNEWNALKDNSLNGEAILVRFRSPAP